MEPQGARMSDTFERKVMSPAERAARKLFKEAGASKTMTEHEFAQKAFQENRERLKALRLARETAAAKAGSAGLDSDRLEIVRSSIT